MATALQPPTANSGHLESDHFGVSISARNEPRSWNPKNWGFAGPVHAFTMIELLVAMTVLALLIVMLMGLVDSSTKLWRENENRVDSFREARAAMGIISRDLGNIVSTSNTNYFLVNEFDRQQQIQSQLKTTNLNGVMYFLAGMPKSAQSGDNRGNICQVGYFMAFGKNSAFGGSATNMNLYRFFVESDDTFQAMTNQTNERVFGGNLNLETDDRVELLARNVVRFSIEPYIAPDAANPVWENFVQSTNTPIPKLLKIKIVAINQEAAKKLENLTAWTETNTPLMQRSMQIFETYVTIPDPQ